MTERGRRRKLVADPARDLSREFMRISYPPPNLGEVAERAGSSPSTERPPPAVTPQELGTWLERHREEIAERWLTEIRSRSGGVPEEVRELLGDFVELLAHFLPSALGAFRQQVQPLFQEAAELYGNLGAHRGLAAGEAVEEFQLLREVILRFIYADPPGGSELGIGLREMLKLNRFLDLGVTYASVGHTDTLFFQLINGPGVGDAPTPEVLDELTEQVRGLSEDLNRLLEFEAEENGAQAAN